MSTSETRKFGKFHITRLDNPDGTGHVYVDNTGPEGYVPAIDFGVWPLHVIQKICGWEAEPPEAPPPEPTHPAPVFNRNGWY